MYKIKHKKQKVMKTFSSHCVSLIILHGSVCVCVFLHKLFSLLSCKHISPLVHSPSPALVTHRLSLSLKPSPHDRLHWIQMCLHQTEKQSQKERERALRSKP